MSDRDDSPSRRPGSRDSSPSRPGSSGGDRPRASSGASGSQPTGYPAPLGFDPAREKQEKDKRGNTRMELPPDAYTSPDQQNMFALRGNKFNTQGKPETVLVNQYRMTKFNFNKTIYQYDVALSPQPDKVAPVMRKIWQHPKFKSMLSKYNGDMWISDSKALAWAPVQVAELRCQVDLDENDRPADKKPREGSVFHITLRNTTKINIAVIQEYLNRKMSYGNDIEQAQNFLDHLIRQRPSENLLSIKRNFYNRNGAPRYLDDLIEVHKGAYVSLRMSHNMNQGGLGLALNADVANTCFWTGGRPLDKVALNLLKTADRRWSQIDMVKAIDILRPEKRDNRVQSSDAFKQLRKLRGLKFKVRHPKRPEYLSDKIYSIDDFPFSDKFGPDGGNARNVTFDYNGRQTSIVDYFQSKYGAAMRWSRAPVVKSGKNAYFPLEFCVLEPLQRYSFKLNPQQTADMIKIAVTRPNQRRADIEENVKGLQLDSDPYLKTYGVAFEPTFTKAECRIIAPPVVQFNVGTADPKFSGRWDLRGKKFWKKNVAPLTSWCFIAMENCVSFPQIQQFAQTFKSTFLGHGGVCNSDPLLLNVPGPSQTNAAKAMEWAFEETKRKSGYPQLIFVVVEARNSAHYERLKKSADCRFGVLSQMVNSVAVRQNNGQYHSNVCMKVNAKLGGATSCTAAPWKPAQAGRGPPSTYFPRDRPTMIIGVDISHAAPGGVTPSFAAMTMSVDPDATRYAAVCETNGYRVEILTQKNARNLFGQLFAQWCSGHPSMFPKHIIYMRDGVAEGQFAHVIEQEIAHIKAYLRERAPKMPLPKFTVIIATKRHHIRFFPQKGDKNGNTLPGTVVEKEVTHPFMWDFYLNSHVAIQGTARPVHYHVLLDEMGIPVNDLQKMIYHQCYSYARSTTPVSLHPAVYYAHLASNRCRPHENIATSEGFRVGGKGHEVIRDAIAKGKTMRQPDRTAEAPQLLTIGGSNTPNAGQDEIRQRNFFRGTMWYI
ncbi:hypothetical protein S7711_02104 [Stachybotrys chartarum IBT 7711]|uniref:Piwi domain-containing protein n=1 Tax=Stachybotrys chartarum (strain CBS 109288 / IBT 7711) TaxID=1280523 RepID=A0A084ARG4_STACB|nr:hypothetical protein S7711_02104 [Stachybotrys chartarum IBT 7711]KFA48011.1 hypothetical protein S40293_02626 [Stachybotrys chartarum IBT 40293]